MMYWKLCLDNDAIFLFRNVPDDVLEMMQDNDAILLF